MKQHRLLITLLLVALAAQATLAGNKIRVMGQNVENFYYLTEESGKAGIPAGYTVASREAKMAAILQAYFRDDVPIADIYCFNEIECSDDILDYIANNFKTQTGRNFTYIHDGLVTETDQGIIRKSGYVYDQDVVKPYGESVGTGYGNIYSRFMRMQTFEEIASGERFTVSMNHFKAGNVGVVDSQEATQRTNNATNLLASLPNALDPDILVIGDLNSYYNDNVKEPCLQMLVDAGYEEQLYRFDPYTYAAGWGVGNFIDHVFANSTMAEQITSAKFYYVATKYSADCITPYSDHDPYMVEVELKHYETACENIDYSETFATGSGQFTVINNDAATNDWYHPNSADYMQISAYQRGGTNDDWLISPAFDMRGKMDGEIKFDHQGDFGTVSTWPNYMKVYASSDYFGNPATATWTEVNITYPTSKKSWVSVTTDVPQTLIGKERVSIGFRYTYSENKSNAPTWRVKNFQLNAQCSASAVRTVTFECAIGTPHKVMQNGRLVIVTPNGSRYNVQGIEMK